MTISSTRRAVAAIAATACIAIAASTTAMAQPYSPPATATSDAAQSGDHGSVQPQTDSSFRAPIVRTSGTTFPGRDFRGGDSPADHPGVGRTRPAPTTIAIVRPERTITRDVDAALPIVLGGSALVLALALLGMTLVRARPLTRHGRTA